MQTELSPFGLDQSRQAAGNELRLTKSPWDFKKNGEKENSCTHVGLDIAGDFHKKGYTILILLLFLFNRSNVSTYSVFFFSEVEVLQKNPHLVSWQPQLLQGAYSMGFNRPKELGLPVFFDSNHGNRAKEADFTFSKFHYFFYCIIFVIEINDGCSKR